jgi:transketolase N-terminal domain/subunit
MLCALPDICDFYPYREKWQAFGWNVIEIDGHILMSLPALDIA